MSPEEATARIERQPKFHELVRRRSRFTWSLVVAILGIYFCLVAVIAFRPSWVRVPIYEGAVLTIAWPLAAGVIVVVWLLMGLYVRRANGEFELLKQDILNEARR